MVIKLKDICDVRDGTHDSPIYVEDGYPLVTSKNIVDGKLDLSVVSYISQEDYDKINERSNVDDGDIIMPMIGTIGNPCLVQGYTDFAIKNVALIKFPNDEIKNKFILYFLKSAAFKRYVASKNKGGTQKFLSLGDIRNIEIPQLSTAEQEDIVCRLEKVESVIKLREQELKQLDNIIKSRFVELFGDVSDFVNITDIAHTYIGLVTTMTKHYCNNGTPLLFNSSIKSDKIVWDGTYLDMEFAEANKSRMHKTNDIVTVHTGDIGTSAVVGEEFNNSLGFATIVTRINDISRYYPRFVSSFLNYGSGKEQLKKYSRDVRNNLNLKDFNRLMVPNVSALEQKRYVDFLEQTDKSKFVVQKALDEAQLLFDSLMQKYFG